MFAPANPSAYPSVTISLIDVVRRTNVHTPGEEDVAALAAAVAAIQANAAAPRPPSRHAAPMPTAAIWAIQAEGNRASAAHAPGGGLIFPSAGNSKPFQGGERKRMRADHRAVMNSAVPLGRKHAKEAPSNSLFVAGRRGAML